MWQFMEQADPSVFVQSNEEGVKRVRETGKYAFLTGTVKHVTSRPVLPFPPVPRFPLHSGRKACWKGAFAASAVVMKSSDRIKNLKRTFHWCLDCWVRADVEFFLTPLSQKVPFGVFHSCVRWKRVLVLTMLSNLSTKTCKKTNWRRRKGSWKPAQVFSATVSRSTPLTSMSLSF